MIWLVTNEKVSLQNFKLTFPVILRVFDLECQVLKVAFVMFDLVFMKFRKLESIH